MSVQSMAVIDVDEWHSYLFFGFFFACLLICFGSLLLESFPRACGCVIGGPFLQYIRNDMRHVMLLEEVEVFLVFFRYSLRAYWKDERA